MQGSLKRTGRLMLIYAALLVGLSWAFVRLPGGFLPVDDQGFITTDVQTPSESSYGRTEAAVEKVEKYLLERSGIENVTFLTGFSFLGQGLNTAQAFISLKDWSERGPKDSAANIVADINKNLAGLRDARVTALQPPPIDNLGNSSGFSFRLQDRGQKGFAALTAAADRLVSEANASPVLQKVFIEGLPPAPQVNLMIDREKAGAFGLTFEDINNTISTNLGSNYINDFPNRGRMQRVIVQADAPSRMKAEDLLNYNVKNSRGQLVPFSAFASIDWSKGPTQIAGFNYYPAVRITGEAKPGYTSGDAIKEMERLAGKLPRGFGYDWTGQSLQEKLSGSQAPFLLGLSVLVVFLLLAALYESWTIPLAVLLTVPLGIAGAVVAATMRGLPNDVYFTVGLITIIGLAAKDAILIIEFAKDLRAHGKPLVEATLEACSLRFRPILMTGLAFVCGVLPMVVAHGAGGASQQALGTSVMGGMIAVVILALLMVPVFFVSVQRTLAGDREKVEKKASGRARGARAGGVGVTPCALSRMPRRRALRRDEAASQRLQDLHQFGVHELVAADDMAGGQRVVVTADAGDEAAGFAHHDLAGRDVPGLQIALPVAVEAADGDEGHVERGGAEATEARDLVLQFADLAARLLVVAAADMRQAAGDHAFVELAPSGHAEPLVVEERALAALGDVELLIGGVVDHAGDDSAFARQADRDRELRNAVQEIGGAVERIDDPGMALVGALARAAFLADEAVAGSRFREVGVEHLLGALVGERDEIGRALQRDLQMLDLAEVALQAAAGAARGLDHDVDEGGIEHAITRAE